MTDIEIDALQPGRELDGMIEERIFQGQAANARYYSTNFSASLALRFRLQELGWAQSEYSLDRSLRLRVGLLHPGTGVAVEAVGPTAATALCKAALKAVAL